MSVTTIDIEPTWAALCRMAQTGHLPAKELMPACEIADVIRQAQKKGAASVTFTFADGKVEYEVKEANPKNKVVVITARRAGSDRKYGYVLQWLGDNCPSYIIGKNQTFEWHKRKVSAQKRADYWNNEHPDMKKANKE